MTRRSSLHVRLYRKIQKTLSENVETLTGVKKILLGFSGGVDSTVLLHLLKDVCSKNNVDMVAVHVHHGLRGREADEDAAFCQSYCMEHAVPFFLERLAPSLPTTPEHELRKRRYRSLLKIARQAGAERIFLAHHQDDQAETVLFRFLTGTDLLGLKGMRVFRSPYFVRPMLDISKKEILEEARLCGIPYRIDSSNVKTHARRNFLRQQLIPLIETQFNPNIRNHLSYLSDTFVKCHELVEMKLDEAERAVTIRDRVYSVQAWKAEHRYLRACFISRAYRKHRRGEGVLRRLQIALVEKMLSSKNPYGEVHLPGEVRCVKMKDKFYFEG